MSNQLVVHALNYLARATPSSAGDNRTVYRKRRHVQFLYNSNLYMGHVIFTI